MGELPSENFHEDDMREILSTTLACALARSAVTPSFAGELSADFPVQLIYDKVTEGDIEGAKEYLTDNAVYLIVTAPGPWEAPALVGPEAIGKWWTGIHKENGRFEVSDLMTDGDRSTFTGLYYGDRLEKIGMSPAEFDGLAVLRDGKVRVLALSYSAEYEPKLRAAAAQARSFASATEGWAIDNGKIWFEGPEIHAIPASDGGPNFFIAPPRFLGDWSEYQEIVFDKKSSGGAYSISETIILRNGNMRASLLNIPKHHTGEWLTFHVTFDADSWVLAGGANSLMDVLANVTSFEILAEYAKGKDQTAIRNVELK